MKRFVGPNRSVRQLFVTVALVVMCWSSLCSSAFAIHSERYEGFSFEQLWSAAVRLLVVDMSCTIKDRDKDTGYLIFEYKQGRNAHTGSLQIIRQAKEKQETLHVMLGFERLPSYFESMILDNLKRKVMAEYGKPKDTPSDKKPTESKEQPPENKKPSDTDTPTPPKRKTSKRSPFPPMKPKAPSAANAVGKTQA